MALHTSMAVGRFTHGPMPWHREAQGQPQVHEMAGGKALSRCPRGNRRKGYAGRLLQWWLEEEVGLRECQGFQGASRVDRIALHVEVSECRCLKTRRTGMLSAYML